MEMKEKLCGKTKTKVFTCSSGERAKKTFITFYSEARWEWKARKLFSFFEAKTFSISTVRLALSPHPSRGRRKKKLSRRTLALLHCVHVGGTETFAPRAKENEIL